MDLASAILVIILVATLLYTAFKEIIGIFLVVAWAYLIVNGINVLLGWIFQ